MINDTLLIKIKNNAQTRNKQVLQHARKDY